MLIEPSSIEVDSLEELLEMTSRGVAKRLQPLLFWAYNPSPQPKEYCPVDRFYTIGKEMVQDELRNRLNNDFVS